MSASAKPLAVVTGASAGIGYGTVSIVGGLWRFSPQDAHGIGHQPGPDFPRMAQTPMQSYLPKLLQRIEKGEIDPSFVYAPRRAEGWARPLQDVRDKKDGCIKVVMKP